MKSCAFKLSAGISWLTFVAGSVTVAFPVSSTVTVLPGFAFSTAALIFAISSGVTDAGFATAVLSGTTGVKSSITSYSTLTFSVLWSA